MIAKILERSGSFWAGEIIKSWDRRIQIRILTTIKINHYRTNAMDKKFIVSKLKLKFIIIINKKKGGLDNYV